MIDFWFAHSIYIDAIASSFIRIFLRAQYSQIPSPPPAPLCSVLLAGNDDKKDWMNGTIALYTYRELITTWRELMRFAYTHSFAYICYMYCCSSRWLFGVCVCVLYGGSAVSYFQHTSIVVLYACNGENNGIDKRAVFVFVYGCVRACVNVLTRTLRCTSVIYTYTHTLHIQCCAREYTHRIRLAFEKSSNCKIFEGEKNTHQLLLL